MGCFLGCFGGEKAPKRRKQRVNRASPHHQRNRIQNVQQEDVVVAERSVKETDPVDLVSKVSELGNKPEVVEQRSPSSRKRVTFNSNVTTYEHVPVHESFDSLPDCAANEEEKQEYLKSSGVGSYPPNHRYHNARESDDEAEEYGDSDLDEEDEDEDEDEDDYSDEDIDSRLLVHEVRSESISAASMELRTGNPSPPAIICQEVESLMVKTHLTDEEVREVGSRTNGRVRSDYINSVLNPVENITQWKAVKSKGTTPLLKKQKENISNLEAPRISFSSEPTFGQTPCSFMAKSHQLKYANQEIAVDASLSNWLASPEVTTPSKKPTFSGFETTTSEGCTSARSFEDRPILGALTVEELRQFSASPSPRKSPCRSPDEMPIIGTVGTYWNNSRSAIAKHSGAVTSFKGIPNTTSKYTEIVY